MIRRHPRTRIRPLAVALAAGLLLAVGAAGPGGAAPRYTLDNDPVRLGQRALAAGDLDQARARFEEAVAHDYQLPEAFHGLARVAQRQGRFADAEAACRQALAAAGGSFAPARADLGLLLLRAGRTDEARTELTRARDADPKLWRAHYGLARLALQAGDLERARAELERGHDRKGVDEGEDLYRHGEALLLEATGDLEGAERAALQATAVNPADPEHAELLARLYAARGYDALAIGTYEDLLARPGVQGSAALLHGLGRLYAAQHRYNEASSRYLQAMAADSTYAPAVKDLAGLFSLAGRWDKAAGTWLRYLELEPDDEAARADLAAALLELGRYREAATAAQAALDAAPGDARARRVFVKAGLRSGDAATAAAAAAQWDSLDADADWSAEDLLALAAQQEEAGLPEAALGTFARAAALAPDDPHIPYRQGLAAMHAGRPTDAEEPFARAAALEPTEAVYPLNLGIARYQAGDQAGALEAFRQAVAIDGTLVAARLLLAQTLMATGRLDEAATEYAHVRDREPGNAKALRGLGFCRLRQADYQAAATAYAAAAEAEPDNADGWAGLGGARLGLSDLDGAERAFARARAIDPDNPMLKAGTALLTKARSAGKEDQ